MIWYADHATLPTPETHDSAKVVKVFTQLSSDDPYGKVSDAEIVLRGFVITAKIRDKRMCPPDGRVKIEPRKDLPSCFLTLDSQEDYDELEVGQGVTCLDLMRDRGNDDGPKFVSGLALLPSATESGCYRRIGFSTMLADHFVDAEIDVLTII